MNRPDQTQESSFQLPVQQMLFVLLAVLVTLIGVQQYSRFNPVVETQLLPPQTRFIAIEQLNPVSAKAPDRAFQPMQGSSEQALSEQPRWVF